MFIVLLFINSLITFQGLIDIEKEISRLDGKKDRLGSQLKKLTDTSSMADYSNKVPDDVRKQNSDKVGKIVFPKNLELGKYSIS